MAIFTKLFNVILPSDSKQLKIAEIGYFSLTFFCLLLLYFATMQTPQIKLSHHYVVYFIMLFFVLWQVAMYRFKRRKKGNVDDANK